MARIMIDLDDTLIEQARTIYGTTTKAAAVRAATEDAVNRHLRRQFVNAIKNDELTFPEIIEATREESATGRNSPGAIPSGTAEHS